MVLSECFLWVRSLILERIWTLVRGSYARSADQVSILLSSFADFIWGSRIMYYISALIVERNKQEVVIFIKFLMIVPCCIYGQLDYCSLFKLVSGDTLLR